LHKTTTVKTKKNPLDHTSKGFFDFRLFRQTKGN